MTVRALLCLVVLPLACQAVETTATEAKLDVLISFLDRKEAAAKLTADADGFIKNLRRREAATMTGVDLTEKDEDGVTKVALEVFGNATLDFSKQEQDALKQHIEQLDEKFGETYPLLVRHPWQFLKIRNQLCGGFSFTRDDTIVFSQRTLKRLVTGAEKNHFQPGEGLLLHEQLHVLQRQQPRLFDSLYEQLFSFRRVQIEVDPWITERKVRNPDGMEQGWAIEMPSKDNKQKDLYWLGTLLLQDKPVHTMGRDFATVVVPLKPSENGYSMQLTEKGIPITKPIGEFQEYTTRLPIPPAYDHPNEVAAYLFTKLTRDRPQPDRDGVSQKARDWFTKNFSGKNKKTITNEN